MNTPRRSRACRALTILVLCLVPRAAPAAKGSTERLAKETQNPVANLISVPTSSSSSPSSTTTWPTAGT